MSFAWPLVLVLLLAPATLLLLGILRRREAAGGRDLPAALAGYATGGHFRTTKEGHEARLLRRGARPLLCLALALSIVALARPQWGVVEERVFQQSREILVALDLSRSMLAQDIKPSRLERAKLLTRSLLDRLRGERVGLLVFSGTAFLQSPLSTDYGIIEELLPELKPGFLPSGGTNFGPMIDTALDAFDKAENTDRFLIILSDGEDLELSWVDRLPELKRRGIHVLSLGVGSAAGITLTDEAGALIKDERGAAVLSRLQPESLLRLADETKGAYRDASTWVDLQGLIADTVEQARQGNFSETRAPHRIDRYQWPLAAALVCALLSMIYEFPLQVRPRRIALAAVKSSLVLLSLLAFAPTDTQAAETAVEAPLIQTIRRLANNAPLDAGACKRLAEDTLSWGRGLRESGQPLAPGVIRDGLEAVDLGATQNEKAADWPTLRRELEGLLRPLDPPKQDQNQQPQSPQNQSSSSDSKSEKQSQDKQDAPAEPKQQPASADKNPARAFDNPPPSPKPKPGQSQETRQVGGAPKDKPLAPAEPSLVAPLEKLEQLHKQDSPARLFQLMEDKGKAENKESQPRRNW